MTDHICRRAYRRHAGGGGLAAARVFAAALILAPALVLAPAACEVIPATADQIADTVIEKERADEEAREAARHSLKISFETALETPGYKLIRVKPLDTWGQTDAAYTLTTGGIRGGIPAYILSNLYVPPDERDAKRYHVDFKQKSETAVNVGGLYLLESAAVGTQAEADFSFQIFNPDKRDETINGVLTLLVLPTETGVLDAVESDFERQLRWSADNGGTILRDLWVEKPLNARWTQTDALFSATAAHDGAPGSTATLPKAQSAASEVAYAVTWAVAGRNDSGLTLGDGTDETLTAGSLGAGKTLTLLFTLGGVKQVAGKSVTGALAITVK